MRLDSTCLHCGNPFQIKPSRLNIRKYCSRTCYKAARSTTGEITPADIARFWSQVDKSGECWVWIGSRYTRGGYGRCRPYYRSGQRKAHRVSYELAYGPIPEGMCVCHRCDNPPCVRPDHLFLGTSEENTYDMFQKGRAGGVMNPQKRPVGERCSYAKLTDAQVAEIRARYAQGGISQRQLGELYGVSRSTICNIVMNTAWKHVAGPDDEPH